MVTYNELYDALRKERYSEELQVLPKNFARDVKKYFEEKKQAGEKDDDLFSDMTIKTKKKLENAISIFKELMIRRRRKILNLSFVASETGISKKDFENLLGFEKEMFEEIVKSLEKADKNLSSEMQGNGGDGKKYRLVRFLENVEGFLNLEGEEVGGFEKGEVANLEREIVDVLAGDKRVEVLEEE